MPVDYECFRSCYMGCLYSYGYNNLAPWVKVLVACGCASSCYYACGGELPDAENPLAGSDTSLASADNVVAALDTGQDPAVAIPATPAVSGEDDPFYSTNNFGSVGSAPSGDTSGDSFSNDWGSGTGGSVETSDAGPDPDTTPLD